MPETLSETESGYTRSELRLRPGIKELAAAVIEQWIRDDRPSTDMPSIEVWMKVVTFEDK